MGKLKVCSVHTEGRGPTTTLHCRRGRWGPLTPPSWGRGSPPVRPPRAKMCLPPHHTSMDCNLSVTSDSRIRRAPASQRQRLFGRSRHDWRSPKLSGLADQDDVAGPTERYHDRDRGNGEGETQTSNSPSITHSPSPIFLAFILAFRSTRRTPDCCIAYRQSQRRTAV